MGSIVSTVIICGILILICIFSVRSYMKKLKNGCCGSGGDSIKRIQPQDREVEHYPYIKRAAVEGMTCKNCAIRIENAFHRQEGFLVQVNLRHRCAVVRSKQPISDDTLRMTIQRLGYQVKNIESEEENGSL